MTLQEENDLLKSGNKYMCEELETLRAALEPFRIAANAFADCYGDGVKLGTELVTVGMLRRARAALMAGEADRDYANILVEPSPQLSSKERK